MKLIITLFVTANLLLANNNLNEKHDRLEIKKMMEETTLPVKKIYKKYNKKEDIHIEDFSFNPKDGRIYSLLNNDKIIYEKKEIDFGKNIQTFTFNDNNEFFFIEKDKFFISKVSPSRNIINKTRIEKRFEKEQLFSSSFTEIQDMVFYNRNRLVNNFYILHNNIKNHKSYIALIDNKGNVLSNIKLNIDNASSLFLFNNEFLITSKFENKLYKVDIDGTIKNEYIIPFKNVKDILKIDDELYFSVNNNYYIFKLKDDVMGVSDDFKENKIEITNEDKNKVITDSRLNDIENRIRKDYQQNENYFVEKKIKKRKKTFIPEIRDNEINYELDQKINDYKLNTDMDFDEIFDKKK